MVCVLQILSEHFTSLLSTYIRPYIQSLLLRSPSHITSACNQYRPHDDEEAVTHRDHNHDG